MNLIQGDFARETVLLRGPSRGGPLLPGLWDGLDPHCGPGCGAQRQPAFIARWLAEIIDLAGSVPVQIGGGIRTSAGDPAKSLDAGAARAVVRNRRGTRPRSWCVRPRSHTRGKSRSVWMPGMDAWQLRHGRKRVRVMAAADLAAMAADAGVAARRVHGREPRRHARPSRTLMGRRTLVQTPRSRPLGRDRIRWRAQPATTWRNLPNLEPTGVIIGRALYTGSRHPERRSSGRPGLDECSRAASSLAWTSRTDETSAASASRQTSTPGTLSNWRLVTTAKAPTSLSFTTSPRRRRAADIMVDLVERVASQVFIPLSVGGGVRTIDDMYLMLRSGAEKVSINSAAHRRPRPDHELVPTDLALNASCYRSMRCAIRTATRRAGRSTSTAAACVRSLDAVEIAQRGQAARRRRDCAQQHRRGRNARGLRRRVSASRYGCRVESPSIASGGAGSLEHLRDADNAVGHAHAVLAASIFHFAVYSVQRSQGIHGVCGHPRCGSIRTTNPTAAADQSRHDTPNTRAEASSGRALKAMKRPTAAEGAPKAVPKNGAVTP